MSLPLFPSGDPGPSFSELLKRVGDAPVEGGGGGGELPPGVTHGTTVVAIRYAEGVIMAGDRRAPEGSRIAHRAIEKVLPADFHSTGSGGRDARTAIKLGWKDGIDRAAAIELAIEGLYEAADEDTATGGPDPVRGIYPTVATITADGFQRVDEPEVAERFQALIQRKTTEGHPA